MACRVAVSQAVKKGRRNHSISIIEGFKFTCPAPLHFFVGISKLQDFRLIGIFRVGNEKMIYWNIKC